jgi:hypothetical protein
LNHTEGPSGASGPGELTSRPPDYGAHRSDNGQPDPTCFSACVGGWAGNVPERRGIRYPTARVGGELFGPTASQGLDNKASRETVRPSVDRIRHRKRAIFICISCWRRRWEAELKTPGAGAETRFDRWVGLAFWHSHVCAAEGLVGVVGSWRSQRDVMS